MPRRINVNFRYDDHISLYGKDCYYCGQYADTVDHVPAVNMIKFYTNYYKILVKTCRECNFCLSDRMLPTLISRLEFLDKKYRKRYLKLLKQPEWNEEELGELKGSLKKYVEEEVKNKFRIEKRLFHITKQLEELLGGMDAKEHYALGRTRSD